MKPYRFIFTIHPEDHKRRVYLEKTMRDKSGRKMSFAQIVRELMIEKESQIPLRAMQELIKSSSFPNL